MASIGELSSASAERSSRFVQLGQSLRWTDVMPLAAMQVDGDQAAYHRRTQQRCELPLGAGSHAGKELGPVQTDSAEGRFVITRFADLRSAQHEVPLRMVRRIVHKDQMREVPFQGMHDQSGEIEVAENVAIDG